VVIFHKLTGVRVNGKLKGTVIKTLLKQGGYIYISVPQNLQVPVSSFLQGLRQLGLSSINRTPDLDDGDYTVYLGYCADPKDWSQILKGLEALEEVDNYSIVLT